MIVIAGIVLGAVLGAVIARKNGGKPADMAQYAAASAMVFGIVAMIATVLLDRFLV